MDRVDQIKRAKQSLRIAETNRGAKRRLVAEAQKAFDEADENVNKYLRELARLGVSDAEICDLSRTP